MPQPTTPTVILSEGGVRRPLLVAQEENSMGEATANPVAARKRRRLMPEEKEDSFMGRYDARSGGKRREKNGARWAVISNQ
jgi:hypothetical protein